MKSAFVLLAVAAVAAVSACSPAAAPPPVAPAAAPPAVVVAAEPTFAAELVGPLGKATALQIVALFSYEPGEKLVSPASEMASFVSDAREHQGFGREALRSLPVLPRPASIQAARLLIVAWGDRAEFSVERAKAVGHAAMRETLRLGVADMAFAPIARDQGVTALSADVVAAAFVEGALAELLDEKKAEPNKAIALTRVTYEAGPAFIESVKGAVARGVEAAHSAR